MVPDNDDQREGSESENLVSLADATGQVTIAVTDNIHHYEQYLSEKIVEKAAVCCWSVKLER